MQLLTIAQFARVVPAMTESAVRHRVDRGSMPGVKRIGKRVFIDLDAFQAELESPCPESHETTSNRTQVARKRVRQPGWEL